MHELKPIPGREQLSIKDEFVSRYRALLGKDFDEFMRYSTSFIRRSIRVNTLKIPVAGLKKRLELEWELEQVPWCREGFWIRGKRLDIGNLVEHLLGYFYVQEAASMIPPLALNPEPGEVVLDMCAAPGSKTTQIAAMMQNKGVLIANDISGDRIKALGLNLNRAGVSNAIITHSAGRSFQQAGFDRILVDAPCSATGTVRRNFKVLQQYSYGMVRRLASMQRGLIGNAYSLLKPGGVLVYSTCSMEPEENEGVVDYLLKKEESAKIEEFELKIRRAEPILNFDGFEYGAGIRDCLRIWPQDNDTEGFFVARIIKKG